MAIQLSQSERDYLKQLTQHKIKPTRRQKAIVLLRLSEGATLETAARVAGIHKDEVVAIAARFSEDGLAGVGLVRTSEMLVALVQPGVGVREYRLPEGGTLADLLSRSGASTMDQMVLVDDIVSEESTPLHEGAVVTIVPAPRNGAGTESQHRKVPSLRDDDLFQQYRDILTARRKMRAREGDPGGVNILDTDALSHHMKMNSIGAAIEASIKSSPDREFWITSINAFEMVDVALALYKELRKKRKDLIPGFDLIQEVIEYLGSWRGRIHPYDAGSERIYRGFAPSLRQQLGDDVRIAAIALARGAAVWTCNLDDFKRVHGLTVHSPETGLRVT